MQEDKNQIWSQGQQEPASSWPTPVPGGLGAPLVKGLAEADGGFHHFLLLDILPGDRKTTLQVEVVRFHGTSTRDQEDER